MLQWISENVGTILICMGLIVIVALIVRSLIRQKKQGKSSCGAGCAHCAMHGQCHTGAENAIREGTRKHPVSLSAPSQTRKMSSK